MLILVPIAFAAGVITAFTPCILPVLPIVLAGGVGATTNRRPYAIAAGLVTTFTGFLLAGAWLWSLIGVSPKHQIKIGAALLLVLAVILVVPKAGERVERPFAFLTRRRAGDLGGGFLLGASLGLVFIPCGGPVLATLTANAATNRVGGWIVLIAIGYALGAALPMLEIARGSRSVVSRFRQHAQAVRVTGGVLMAVSALVIYQGWAESLQTKVPGYANWVQSAIEGNSAAQNGLDRLGGRSKQVFVTGGEQLATRVEKVPLKNYGSAPDVHEVSAWINTKPLSLAELRGKVVLVDFWTYSCINCLRTLPYLKAWVARYRAAGLTIIGVHAPEFTFEKDAGNVAAAVDREAIRYPVVQDNELATWSAYGNQGWPSEYFVDALGRVRFYLYGEGAYREKELVIRALLAEAGRSVGDAPPVSKEITLAAPLTTAESYLGALRADRFANGTIGT